MSSALYLIYSEAKEREHKMSLPPNVHVSKHPCLMAKLSRLRSKGTASREVKTLVNDIATILGCEALATALTPVDGPKVRYLGASSLIC